jgi:regulator of sigma E protease
MSELLWSLAGFVIAISILVVVHELGHYGAAKLVGVRVLRFSVGFGRALWARRLGADRTEWVIAALPFGGYVKMLDEREGRVAARERRRAFNRQPLASRALIVVGGPAANFLFAVLAYWLIYSVGIEGVQPVVGRVGEDSIAAAAGFRAGDTLVSFDAKPVLSWDHRRLYLYQKALAQEPVEVVVRDADGLNRTLTLDLSGLSPAQVSAGLLEREIGLYGYLPPIAPVVGSLEPGGAAARAGLQVGDRVVAINGGAVATWQELVERVSASPERELRLRLERAGATREVRLTPAAVESDGRRIGRIGVAVRPPELPATMRATVRFAPAQALLEGAQQTWAMSVITVELLYRMLRLEVSTRTISGPISIAQYAGHSARVGLDRFVLFLAVVSISLGVLNLLPVPVLDGGHLLYFLIEAVSGRPLSERALYWGQQIGVLLLAALMALAFYNDLLRLLQ